MRRFLPEGLPVGKQFLAAAFLGTLLILPGMDGVEAGMSFNKKMTLLNPEGAESTVTQKVYVEGAAVRTEEDAREIEGNPGVHIYDFEKKKVYTILKDINLYMEDNLSTTQEALLRERDPQTLKRYSESEEFRIEKVRLPDAEIQGHPAAHYEIRIFQRPAKKGEEEKVVEHYFQWVREDLEGGMPVRYEFESPSKAKKIVEYLDIVVETLDPGLFQVPEGYLKVQPF